MKKYLLKIEFRYKGVSKFEYDSQHKTKVVTLGVFEDLNIAHKKGNELMMQLESKFKLHTFPCGRVAKKERFSLNGGAFGRPVSLITNLAYLKTPFDFYVSIITLNYENVNNSIEDVLKSVNQYKKN